MNALLPPEASELQCRLCGYTPSKTGIMEKLKAVLVHYAKKHMQDRVVAVLPSSSLACPTCSYTAIYWLNLRNHWCTVHNTLQIWVRELPKDDLGVMHFRCKVCGKKFWNTCNLRRHERQVHEPKKARDQVKCEFCDYTMPFKSDMAMTLMTMLHHQDRVVKIY